MTNHSDQLHHDHVEELSRGNCRLKQKEISGELAVSKERVGYLDSVDQEEPISCLYHKKT